MPDPYLESVELLGEIRRLRPSWLLERPELGEYRRLKRDYKLRKKHGYWHRLSKGIEIASPEIRVLETLELDLARKEAKEIRARVRLLPAQGEHTPLQDVFGLPLIETEAFGRMPVEYWRVPTMYHVIKNLNQYANPYTEWTDGYVDIRQMMSNANDLSLFFLQDISPSRMRRSWLRASFEFLQSYRRVTDGTPGDSQLATFLCDADYVVTSDRNLAAFSDRVFREAPFSVAKPLLLPGGTAAAPSFFSWAGQLTNPC